MPLPSKPLRKASGSTVLDLQTTKTHAKYSLGCGYLFSLVEKFQLDYQDEKATQMELICRKIDKLQDFDYSIVRLLLNLSLAPLESDYLPPQSDAISMSLAEWSSICHQELSSTDVEDMDNYDSDRSLSDWDVDQSGISQYEIHTRPSVFVDRKEFQAWREKQYWIIPKYLEACKYNHQNPETLRKSVLI